MFGSERAAGIALILENISNRHGFLEYVFNAGMFAISAVGFHLCSRSISLRCGIFPSKGGACP